MANIGDLSEIEGQVTFKWEIKNFHSLSDEKNASYNSTRFYFCDTSWNLAFYPNRETKGVTDGWIGLYLIKRSFGPPVTVNCTFSIEAVNGKNDIHRNFTHLFDKKDAGYGAANIILRSVLFEKKSELIPSDVLTIKCTLKHSESKDTDGSLFNRIQDVSENLKEIYKKAKRADLLLKTNGGNIRAHRNILETRSPVFATMFSHDTKEKQTGEIVIEDMDKTTIESILQYLYSGQSSLFEKLTVEKAISVYAAAEKYQIKDVKKACLKSIAQNLSVDCFCDIIMFAEFYQDEELGRTVRDFFKANASEILETDNWKSFAKENHEVSVELLGSIVKSLLLK